MSVPSQRADKLWLALPVLLTVGLYLLPAFGADWVIDDRPLIPDHLRPGDILGEWTTPTHVHAADRAGGYLWRPLTSTLYQVVGELFGRTPAPFRLLNLVLHLANLGLLLAVARRLGASARQAGLLATAWAVHPLLPDVVCWMADTYDLLAASFLLGSLWVALGHGDPQQRSSLSLRSPAAAALFFAALLSKEASLAWLAALPGVLLLLRGWRPALLQALALAAAALVHSSWHHRIVGDFETSASDLLLGAPGDFLALWTDYLRWPLHLPVQAGFTHLVQPGAEQLSLLGLALLLVGIGAAISGLRPGHGRAAHLGAALCTWAVMVSPGALAALGFGQQASRYLYLPLVVALPLLAGALPRLDGRRAWIAGGLVAAWCLAWMPRTLPRIAAWSGERPLFEDEVRAEPDNAFAVKGLGRILVSEGEPQQGLKLWYWALQHPPSSSFVMDLQQERLHFAQAAASQGLPGPALEQLEAFLADERAAGHEVDPSVLRFAEQLRSPAR